MPSNKALDAALELLKKDPSKRLTVTIGKHTIAETGQFVPKADTQATPQLSYSSTSADKTYLAMCLDPDAPFAAFPVLGPSLHWLQPGLKLGAAAGPPPGSSPHRYIFLLYEQPPGLDGKQFATKDGKDMGIGPRIRTSLDQWVSKLGLGEPVAINFFTSN